MDTLTSKNKSLSNKKRDKSRSQNIRFRPHKDSLVVNTEYFLLKRWWENSSSQLTGFHQIRSTNNSCFHQIHSTNSSGFHQILSTNNSGFPQIHSTNSRLLVVQLWNSSQKKNKLFKLLIPMFIPMVNTTQRLSHSGKLNPQGGIHNSICGHQTLSPTVSAYWRDYCISILFFLAPNSLITNLYRMTYHIIKITRVLYTPALLLLPNIFERSKYIRTRK